MCVTVSDINFDVVSGFGPLFLHILLNLYLLFLKILSFLLHFFAHVNRPLASALRRPSVHIGSTKIHSGRCMAEAWCTLGGRYMDFMWTLCAGYNFRELT